MQELSLSELSRVAGGHEVNPSICKTDVASGMAARVVISWGAVLMFLAMLTLAVTSRAIASPILVPIESLIEAEPSIDTSTGIPIVVGLGDFPQRATIGPASFFSHAMLPSFSPPPFSGASSESAFVFANIDASADADTGSVSVSSGWLAATTVDVRPDFTQILPQWQYSFHAIADGTFQLTYTTTADYSGQRFFGFPQVTPIITSFAVLWNGVDVRDIADFSQGSLLLPLVGDTDYEIIISSVTRGSDSLQGDWSRSGSFAFDAIPADVARVSEPATTFLMAFGFGLVLIAGHRRRARR